MIESPELLVVSGSRVENVGGGEVMNCSCGLSVRLIFSSAVFSTIFAFGSSLHSGAENFYLKFELLLCTF